MKLAEYHGPLELQCFDCNQTVTTHVKWGKKVTVCGATGAGEMGVKMTGQRHCPLCKGTKLGVERVVLEFTLDK